MRKRPEIIALPQEAILIDAKLEALDLPTLLTISVDFLTICARRSAEIDPAVAAVVAYARDEIVEHMRDDASSEISWSGRNTQTTVGPVKPTRN
jgi:hypothetical protein